MNVLIDSDIGDDVDDAFALALAARLPQLRLCGVSTVCGRVEARAALARRILDAAELPGLPVAAGAWRRADGLPLPTRFSHAPLLARGVPPPSQFTGDAVELILRCAAEQAPLTIIGLGPMTNLAAALGRDPTLARRAHLIAVGGVLGLPYPDWNLRSDPLAAQQVLASGMRVTLIGLHLTFRCKLWPEQLRRLFASSSPLARALGACVLAWRTWKRRIPMLHDALAVAALAEPGIARLLPHRVAITRRGVMRASRRGPANALVGVGVDLDRFHALLARYLFESSPRGRPHSWVEHLVHQLA
jgi:purine nucleosidase